MSEGRETPHILTINSGSSSVKFALYRMGREHTLEFSGVVDRIGVASGLFRVNDGNGQAMVERRLELPDHDAALRVLVEWIEKHLRGARLDAAGHRLVHGGRDYAEPQLINPGLLRTLETLIPLAPDHLPHELKAVEAIRRSHPELPQVACFDTAFHRRMPDVAQRYALPRRLRDEGVIRYGFHGLSYEYITACLRREAGAREANGRVIIAHLGNGASMAAVRNGKCVDTTMGFTPAGGLVMSTRCGDLDPGIVVYLVREKKMDSAALNDLINQDAGLLGVSGTSSDMQDLLARAESDAQAAAAVDTFCYQARKFVAALAAALGGLDTLVFTAGIGENAAEIRRRICSGMRFLGLELDAKRNAAHAPVISRKEAAVTVRVMKTNETLVIAEHTHRLLRSSEGNAGIARSAGNAGN